jgi:hypothetical protein
LAFRYDAAGQCQELRAKSYLGIEPQRRQQLTEVFWQGRAQPHGHLGGRMGERQGLGVQAHARLEPFERRVFLLPAV